MMDQASWVWVGIASAIGWPAYYAAVKYDRKRGRK